MYAPDLQVAYETFGCNEGNVFFMGIDKGNSNVAVMEFDSIYGVHYPSASGQQGGGNAVHFQYDILGTPTIVVITPDKLIANQQISPPNTTNVVTAVTAAGGIQQSCLTSVDLEKNKPVLSMGPNPVADDLTIQIENGFDWETLGVKISSLNGTIALMESFRYKGQPAINMIVSGLKPGFYVVEVSDGSAVIDRNKIIVRR